MADEAVEGITFLFTDIEGSTALWEKEPERMRLALQRHNVLVGEAIAHHDGYVFKTVGDAFCATFTDAARAIAAAHVVQDRLGAEVWPTSTPLRVRIALYTGDAHLSDGDYYGKTVNRCARLLALARGGQTLLPLGTEKLVRDALPAATSLRDFGMHRLRDLARPVHVFQLVHSSLTADLLRCGGLETGGKGEGATARFDPITLYDLPTLPTVVVEVLRVMQKPDSAAKDVERIIVNDPAISAKILRVANSAFFGFPRKVTTIGEAVSRLGFTNVQGMVIGLAAFDTFRTDKLNLREFWRHSISVATAARLFARRLGCAADEAFTAGILHDIGKLVFVIQAEYNYQRVIELERDADMTSLAAEHSLFQFTHPEVGAVMAERWELPPKYVDAIARHHDAPATSGAERLPLLIALADQAAHASAPGGAFSAAPDEGAEGPLLAAAGVGAADWEIALRQLAESQASVDTFMAALG
jgi:putative nucleotidyltransferase with HDIG domain